MRLLCGSARSQPDSGGQGLVSAVQELMERGLAPQRSRFGQSERNRARVVLVAKAYWIAFYREVRRADAVAAYAKLAGPALEAAGGRMLARGMCAEVREAGLLQRTVLIEFDSLERARAAYASPAYQAALAVLGDAAERDIRFIEGVS